MTIFIIPQCFTDFLVKKVNRGLFVAPVNTKKGSKISVGFSHIFKDELKVLI